jgi:hypothetical protein
VSTMQQQVPPMAAEARTTPDAEDMGAAVEAQMGKIVTELGAALGCSSPSASAAGCGQRWPTLAR